MEVGKLNVTLRPRTGKGMSRSLRRQGLVPGICYGAGLEKPLNIVVAPKALRAALDPAKGRNTVIDVTVDGNGGGTRVVKAMLWEYQIDPLRRDVIHVDLIAIDPDKEVEVDVPLEITGKAAGLIDGGQIHMIRHSIPVRCKPADIPVKFVIDVSPLHIGDTLHASDLATPEGVGLAIPADVGLVSCAAPQVEKEPSAEAAAGAEGAAGEAAEGGDKKEEKADDKKDAGAKKDAGGKKEG